MECAKKLPPLKLALILYNDLTLDQVQTQFEKIYTFPIKDIKIFPGESQSYYTGIFVLAIKKSAAYALVTGVRRFGLSAHESTVLALLLKQLGVRHAITVVVTGILLLKT